MGTKFVGPTVNISVNFNNESSAVAEMADRLATLDMGQKLGVAMCPLFLGGAGSPSNTVD